jgi:hypothetical protein
MPDRPESYDEYCEVLRTLRQRLDQLQFQIGQWAAETLDRFPDRTCKELADDILMSHKTLNEWVNVRRFYLSDGLPAETVQRLAWLHNDRVEYGTLAYTHFRDARRIARQHKELSRAEQVVIALDWMEDIVKRSEKLSVTEARVVVAVKGEDFQAMSIHLECDSTMNLKSGEIWATVMAGITQLESQGTPWRVAVYAVSGNA